MASTTEPELSFAQVKREINLVDLALTLGYEHNREKSGPNMEKGKFHVFDYRGNKNLDQIIISKSPSGDYMYFNRQNDRDKGSVIDFIKFRLENPLIDGIRPTPGKSIWGSVIDNARQFMNLPPEQRRTSENLQKTIAPIERGDQYIPNFLAKTTPLTDTKYLNCRGISNETLQNPLFENTVRNHVHEGIGKNDKPYKFVNTAFLQSHKNNIVGLEIKAQGFMGQAANSLNSAAWWLSNNTPRTNSLIVTESGIDSLSHYQLKKPENTMYASGSGELTDNKIFELKRVIQDKGIKNVKLGFDNDEQGHLFDTKMIAGLAAAINPMTIERNMPGLITVTVTSNEQDQFIALRTRAKEYNQRMTEGYQQVAGSNEPPGNTLNTEIITAGKSAENRFQFHVPKRLETLAFFNKALIESFPMSVKLEVVKSQAKDWNDDLKESLKTKAPQQATTIAKAASAASEDEDTPRRRGMRM
ncbi:biofilm formation regulator BssR [Hymenobacter defluvii]|uniref:Toprim domain-containing protein n=1 Tax=Hymenobacter defluvii TaxID=2054411 RepID=A0ABS3TKI4_9BACT|nr:biofilm formation regulator BssR [Hymenobacter defluvii]MBO3273119.1 toprim domain-containing protein [Hymenobacter defluvii]